MIKSSITAQELIDGMVDRAFQKFKRFFQEDCLEELDYWLGDGRKLTAEVGELTNDHFNREKSIHMRIEYYDIWDNFVGYGDSTITEGMDLKSLRDNIEYIVKDYLWEE